MHEIKTALLNNENKLIIISDCSQSMHPFLTLAIDASELLVDVFQAHGENPGIHCLESQVHLIAVIYLCK
jgi:hypothetical protein